MATLALTFDAFLVFVGLRGCVPDVHHGDGVQEAFYMSNKVQKRGSGGVLRVYLPRAHGRVGFRRRLVWSGPTRYMEVFG